MPDTKQFLIDNPVLKSIREDYARYQDLIVGAKGSGAGMTEAQKHRTINHYKTILSSYVPILMAIIYERDQYEQEQFAKARAAAAEQVARRFPIDPRDPDYDPNKVFKVDRTDLD